MSNQASPAIPTPELRLNDAPNLCSYGLRPFLMTRVFLQLLRQHFADRTNIAEPSLRDQLWSPTDATGIVITEASRWKLAETNKRPAIVVRRDAASTVQLGINNQRMGGFACDNEAYETAMQGGHTLFAIAQEGGIAEFLAEEVFLNLIHFGAKFREKFGLLTYTITSIGGLHALDEATDTYVVPVTVNYAFTDRIEIKQDAPVLKRISFEAMIG